MSSLDNGGRELSLAKFEVGVIQQNPPPSLNKVKTGFWLHCV
jgi:hypothetical protein